MPAALYQVIRQYTGCTKERFASPLNVHWTTTTYWSIHERDQIFGANFDAYSVRWTGGSLATPDFDQYAAAKAVNWAIQSASTALLPTLTIVLLPTYFDNADDTEYMRLVRRNSHLCKLLFTTSSTLVGFEPPGNAPQEQPKRWKCQVRAIAIGNRDGYSAYLPSRDAEWEGGFKECIRKAFPRENRVKGPKVHFAEMNCNAGMHFEPEPLVQPEWSTKATNKFQKRLDDHRNQITLQCASADEDLAVALNLAVTAFKQQQQGQLPKLKYDWRDFIYTDGSALKKPAAGEPGIGAAVHVPAKVEAHQPNTTINVNCAYRSHGTNLTCFNTISRAELAAIHVAAETTGLTSTPDGTIHIATDSLGSMYAIKKAIMRPQDITEHRHQHLLQSIVKAIERAPGVVHFWKVKSHIGIVGNEEADVAAVAVAKGEIEDNSLHHYGTPSNRREDTYWPYVKEVETQVNSKTGELVHKTIYTPLADLGKSLKTFVHPMKNLGQANQNSFYFQKWKQAYNNIAHRFSHKFLSSAKVGYRARKLAVSYRWGVLPTENWLHKCKLRPTKTCLLCGADDGGHHAMSACPALSPSVTKRHNDAGTEIAEAICRGNCGGEVLLTDVGIRKRRATEELPESLQFCRYLKDAELPPGMPAALQQALRKYNGSIPDIFMYKDDDHNQRRYLIVEVKYCRDTNPEHQETRATIQHQQLRDLILEHDPKSHAQLVTLMLGVSGAIYKKFLADMKQLLGVSNFELEALATRLHFMAIAHMEQIWKARATMIKTLRAANRANWSRAKKRNLPWLEADHRKKRKLK